MIEFKSLRIDNDGQFLIIDVNVIPECNNVYLKSIKLDTHYNFTDIGPSNQAEQLYTDQGSKTDQSFSMRYPLKDNQAMYFIYVEVKGTPPPDIPCNQDKTTYTGVAFYLKPIYNAIVPYLKQVERCCEIPKQLIDLLLRYKAIQLSIETGQYRQAMRLYNMYMVDGVSTNVLNCKCYG